MAKSMFMAWASPVDDASDTEFNAWYDGTHVPQMRAAIPAITAVHRYRVADVPGEFGKLPHRIVAGRSGIVRTGSRDQACLLHG